MQRDYSATSVMDFEQFLMDGQIQQGTTESFIAEAGNVYQKWRGISWPFEENLQKPKRSESEQPIENQDLNSREDKETELQDFLENTLKDIAAIDLLTDMLFTAPSITNTQINWVDKWNEDTYKDLGIEETKQESIEDEGLLFDAVHALPNSTESDTLDDMHESDFLKWLKQKNSDKSAFQELKTEPKSSTEEDAVKDPKKGDEKVSKEKSQSKLSKKKKKKELKKILKKSLEMEDEIVSETLANVMVQQGHIEKAIRMYQKLSLIFPEKSAYFAQRIENLEEE